MESVHSFILRRYAVILCKGGEPGARRVTQQKFDSQQPGEEVYGDTAQGSDRMNSFLRFVVSQVSKQIETWGTQH